MPVLEHPKLSLDFPTFYFDEGNRASLLRCLLTSPPEAPVCQGEPWELRQMSERATAQGGGANILITSCNAHVPRSQTNGLRAGDPPNDNPNDSSSCPSSASGATEREALLEHFRVKLQTGAINSVLQRFQDHPFDFHGLVALATTCWLYSYSVVPFRIAADRIRNFRWGDEMDLNPIRDYRCGSEKPNPQETAKGWLLIGLVFSSHGDRWKVVFEKSFCHLVFEYNSISGVLEDGSYLPPELVAAIAKQRSKEVKEIIAWIHNWWWSDRFRNGTLILLMEHIKLHFQESDINMTTSNVRHLVEHSPMKLLDDLNAYIWKRPLRSERGPDPSSEHRLVSVVETTTQPPKHLEIWRNTAGHQVSVGGLVIKGKNWWEHFCLEGKEKEKGKARDDGPVLDLDGGVLMEICIELSQEIGDRRTDIMKLDVNKEMFEGLRDTCSRVLAEQESWVALDPS